MMTMASSFERGRHLKKRPNKEPSYFTLIPKPAFSFPVPGIYHF